MTDLARTPLPAGIGRRDLGLNWGWLLYALGTVINATVAPMYKMIDPQVARIDIVALRGLMIAVLVGTALLVLRRSNPFRIVSPWLHLIRGVLTFATWGLVVISVTRMSLPVFQTLVFAEALLAPLVFRLVVGDLIDRRIWILTAVGFSGVLIACVPAIAGDPKPGEEHMWLAALGAAVSFTFVLALGRRISTSPGGGDQLGPMILTGALGAAILGSAAAGADMLSSGRPTPLSSSWWSAIGLGGFAWLLLSGVASTLATVLLVKGANLGGAVAMMFGLLGLPASYVLAWVWFGTLGGPEVYIGGTVILLALAAQRIRIGRPRRWR